MDVITHQLMLVKGPPHVIQKTTHQVPGRIWLCAKDIFQYIFMKEYDRIFIKIPLDFIFGVSVENKSNLVLPMA